MRQRIAVVLVLLLPATVWPAAGGLVRRSATTRAAAVEGLQADFNNDGFAGSNLAAVAFDASANGWPADRPPNRRQ